VIYIELLASRLCLAFPESNESSREEKNEEQEIFEVL
jgi:hypothetical protein